MGERETIPQLTQLLTITEQMPTEGAGRQTGGQLPINRHPTGNTPSNTPSKDPFPEVHLKR
jgi:hypothetical protein